MELPRSSGILLHFTSLPSPFGIGDIGPTAYEFVDFLEASGHRFWQILPLNPTAEKFNFSPYSSYSAFAGNPLLISPELLEDEKWIDLKKHPLPKEFSDKKVDFCVVQKYKTHLLEEAFKKFQQKKEPNQNFKKFCKTHGFWLNDFALFLALREKFNNSTWTSWPQEVRDRNPKGLKAAEKELSQPIEKVKFIQFLFFSQWEKLVGYAHQKGIHFIGDIPFYINHDSADCWANSNYFKLNEEKQPTKVSGVPPDFFSETGQLWGTPVFDWKVLKQCDFDWWLARIRQNLLLFDMLRLDHFRAFSAYWEVNAGEETATNGKWVKSPGMDFFRIVKKNFPEMPFIAEDLGSLDEPVYKLIKKFNFPGMKVLQFAFGEDMQENPYIPFNHRAHNLVYTGTHDNNTSLGWFKNIGKKEKTNLRKYSDQKVTSKNAHLILHSMALNSVAKLAIFPMQDIIGLGEEAVMNVPGSTEGNWTWRMTTEEIPWDKAENLKEGNVFFGRFL